MPTLPRSRPVGLACCVVLAALTVTSCGGGPADPSRPTTSPTTKTSDGHSTAGTADGAGPREWIQQFCGKPQQDAQQYVSMLKAATEATASQLTAQDMESTKQTLYSTVSSGLDAPMTANTRRLGATTADAADEAARTYLLGVYQRLHRALAAAENRIKTLPTSDVDRFVSAFSNVAGSVVSAVADAKDAITSDDTLGPVYAADPNCL